MLQALDEVWRVSIRREFERDLVLTDIHMPRMNGYALTKALCERGINAPIIGDTGATTADDANRLIECGVNTVIANPSTMDAPSNALSAPSSSN